MDDEGQVEREKHREHQPCWLSVFYMLELKAPVGVGGCTVERKGWMWWGMGVVRKNSGGDLLLFVFLRKN